MDADIRRLTELVARDPSNSAFLHLAEQLRVRGDLESAMKVALRGLERHSLDPEAHALLARICLDRGELQRAFDEWDMALRLAPRHVGALKGLGFISYRWGRLEDAERYVTQALGLVPGDAGLAAALASVRSARASVALIEMPPPAVAETALRGNGTEPADARVAERTSAVHHDAEPPSELFRPILQGAGVQAMLVDAEGLVVAGEFIAADGSDKSQDIGANLSGVSDEAGRAARHLDMGEWTSITFESERAIVAMARAPGESLVVAAATGNTPLGLLRRLLEQVQTRAAAWLEEGR